MKAPTQFKEIIKKYEKEINNHNFDIVYQEMYYAGGKAFVKMFTQILADANISNPNPLYIIIDDKLYKRVD